MRKNSEAYINMRESLDSIVDVILGEFDLIETANNADVAKSAAETSAYALFVRQHVTKFIQANAERQRSFWDLQRNAVSDILKKRAEDTKNPEPQGHCRPGQQEEKGICVRRP